MIAHIDQLDNKGRGQSSPRSPARATPRESGARTSGEADASLDEGPRWSLPPANIAL